MHMVSQIGAGIERSGSRCLHFLGHIFHLTFVTRNVGFPVRAIQIFERLLFICVGDGDHPPGLYVTPGGRPGRSI